MPGLETRDLYQRAVLWLVVGYQSPGAQPVVGEPQEIRCRWNQVRKQIRDPEKSDSLITITDEVVVAQDVLIGSHMWLGTLADWYASGSAGQPDDLSIVVAYPKTLDIKARNRRRTLQLMRLHDSASTE